MTKQVSFSNLEKAYSLEFRNKMNRAEDGTEVMNSFSFTTTNMMKDALGEKISIRVDDVQLTPQEKQCYSFSPNLLANPEFKSTLEGSDIENIISRFASTARNKFMHLEKHPERTNAKFKNIKIDS